MLRDVVVDTNVLWHAENSGVAYYDESRRFLKRLETSTTIWRLDEGWDLNEAKNRSRLLSEYLSKLSWGDLGLSVLAFLARNERVKSSPRCNEQHRRVIRRWVRDTTDQHFVRVACESEEQLFVSHDERSIPQKSRRELQANLGVEIVAAPAAVLRL